MNSYPRRRIAVQLFLTCKKNWTALSPNVADRNLKDSFNYLFKGLQLSAQNKDISMIKTLAYMDLSLVDVLENNI